VKVAYGGWAAVVARVANLHAERPRGSDLPHWRRRMGLAISQQHLCVRGLANSAKRYRAGMRVGTPV